MRLNEHIKRVEYSSAPKNDEDAIVIFKTIYDMLDILIDYEGINGNTRRKLQLSLDDFVDARDMYYDMVAYKRDYKY